MQTIKRAAVILLVLTLVLSCFSPVIAVSASSETGPASTSPAANPNTSGGETSETTADGTTPTTAVTEETEPTQAPQETTPVIETTAPLVTTVPTEATAPEENTEVTNVTEVTEATEVYERETTTLTGHLDSKDADISVLLLDQMVAEGTVLNVQEATLDNETMKTVMSKLNLQVLLDYLAFDMGVADTSVSGKLSVTVTFPSPSIRALDSGSVYLAEIKSDGSIHLVGNADTVVNNDRKIEKISFTTAGLSGSRFVILTADRPSLLGFQTYPEYTVRATYGRYPGIGDSQGGLTYHCWSANGTPSASKPAVCLDSNRLFGSGDNTFSYEIVNSVNDNGDRSPTQSWKNLSQSKRELLMLLCFYGLSDWSPSSRFIEDIRSGNTFAAMQLVAWEWINGVEDGTYTSRYNETVQDIAGQLRSLCYSNPDNIDCTTSYVYIIWPNAQKIYNGRYVWGQALIACHTVNYKPTTGSLKVNKAITGNGSIANWRMELYTSQSAANSGTGFTAAAYTNSNGVATFADLAPGTYYVREAPAERQDRVSATGWTLSTTVLSAVVKSGDTVNAGTITNLAPSGEITVAKAVTSQNPAGKMDGWVFQVATDSGFSNIVKTITTDASGRGSTGKVLAPGTYYVREAPLANQTRGDKGNFQLDGSVVTVTITGSETVLANNGTGVTANNVELSAITVKKAVTSASTTGKLDGWIFQIASDSGFANIVKTLTTDTSGFASTGITLSPGTYYVREAPLANQTRSDKDNFILDSQSVVTVTVQAGETKAALYTDSATAVNVEKGMIRVRKGVSGTDASAANLSGWLFYVYDSGKEVVAQITTGADGYGTSGRLAPGQYTVQEAPMEEQPREDKAMWSQDAPAVTVTVTAGSTVDAIQDSGYTAQNQYGKRLSIQKTFRCEEQTASQLSGNAMYSLAGAEYNIIVNGEVVETLVTNAEGKATSAKSYPIGTTGTLVEITAPAGFLLDSTPVEFTIPASGDYVVEVSDDPTFDPVTQSFQKTDSQTGTAQGGATFAGAIFRWDYYDNTDWSGDPVRTWYFVTDENGAYAYRSESLDSNSESSELYVDANGVPNLPLGSLKVTETAAPAGYDLMPVLYATITQKSNGGIADFDWTEESLQNIVSSSEGITTAAEPQDKTTLGSLTIQKVDKGTGGAAPNEASFAGCEFTIYNRSAGPVKVGDHAVAQPGEVCYVLTVDETGAASTGNIFPIGTYEVKETKGNDFYQCNTEWSETFTITGEEANPQVSVSCENEMLPATIRVQKVNPNDEALPGAKFLLEWSEDGTSWKPVTKSETILAGGCSSEGLDDSGCITTDASGMAEFTGLSPMVQYRISEVATPNGYQLLKEPILVDKLTLEQNYEAAYRVVDNYVFILPKTGASDFLYLPICIAIAFTGFFLVLASDKTKSMYKKGTTK